MATNHARLIELDNKRAAGTLTGQEALELLDLSKQVMAEDPNVGPVGEVDADAIIAAAGTVDTGPVADVHGPSVDNVAAGKAIMAAQDEEQEARMRALKIGFAVVGTLAKAAIAGA